MGIGGVDGERDRERFRAIRGGVQALLRGEGGEVGLNDDAGVEAEDAGGVHGALNVR